MDKNMLEILACPLCKGELRFNEANMELECKFDQLAFPVIDDIPVMLTSKARRMDENDE